MTLRSSHMCAGNSGIRAAIIAELAEYRMYNRYHNSREKKQKAGI